MIDEAWPDDDEETPPVTDAESQALADERAREAKYGAPKLTKGGDLQDENFPRIKSGAVLAAKILLCMGALAIVGSVVYAKNKPKPPAAERDVMRIGKPAEMPSEIVGLEDAAKRQAAIDAAKKQADEYDKIDPTAPDFTTAVRTVGPDASEDEIIENCPAGYSLESCKRMAKRGTLGVAAPIAKADSATRSKYLAQYGDEKSRGEEPGDESYTEHAPPPMSVDWGKRQGSAQAPSGTPAFSMPSMAGAHPQLPPGIGEALAKAVGRQGSAADHGDGDDIKEAFAARTGSLDSKTEERDLGECELTAGTPISAANIMALNTDVPGAASIKVAITQTVYCGGGRQHIAFPAGSEFTATANARVTYGDNRIQVCMNQLRRPPSAGHPNGTVLPIAGCWVAAEMDGTPGWAADVDNHWSQIVAGVALSTVLSLGTTAAAGSQEGFAPTIAQGAARQAGTQMNQAGQKIVQRDLMRKPTLTRDMLQHALVIVTQNQPLVPWVAEKTKRLRRW